MSESNSLLTVITLTMNSQEFIHKCIHSFNNAASKLDSNTVEHLIVDSGSSDRTLDIINELAPETKILKKSPKGLYSSINYAVKNEVNTPFVTYLHSDDEIDSNYLKLMTDKIVTTPNNLNKVFVSTISFIDQKNKNLYSRKPPFYYKFIQKHTNLIFHPNAVYPTYIEEKYPYDEIIGRTADATHIYEIMDHLNHIRVPSAIYKFRISKKSTTFVEGNHFENKNIFVRFYLHIFETNILKRLFMKLRGESYWS